MPHDTHNIGSLGAFRVPIGGVFVGDDACTVVDVAEVFGKAVVQMPPACGVGLGKRVPVAVNMAGIAGERRGSGNKLPYGGVGFGNGAQGGFVFGVNVVFVAPEVGGNVFKAGAADVF